MTLLGFGPERRLRCARDYQQVFNQTLFKVHQPAFLLLATATHKPPASVDPSTPAGHQGTVDVPVELTQQTLARLGLVVAKKKVRRAHERNRLKRLCRESFRLQQQHLPPLDIVILPKAGADLQSNAELQHQLHMAWIKLARLSARQLPSAAPLHAKPR